MATIINITIIIGAVVCIVGIVAIIYLAIIGKRDKCDHWHCDRSFWDGMFN